MPPFITFITLVLSFLTCVLGVISLYRRQQSVKRISEFSGLSRGG